jgi:hypothetical protein
MPRRIPKYRCYKPKNVGLVVINGTQYYLGKFGSPESVAEYNRLIQEWLTHGASLPAPMPSGNLDRTVNELIHSFLSGHAEVHYRHVDGTPTGEMVNFRDSFRPLKELYGRTPAAEFSPLRMKAVRGRMIESGLARSTIDQRVGRIIHLFKWAAGNELVPPGVHHGLKAVSGLSPGRTKAREASPVKPVPEASVDAVRPFVSRQVWAMIELQRLTGARPGEVVIMRTCDVDTPGGVGSIHRCVTRPNTRPRTNDPPGSSRPGGARTLAPVGRDPVPVQPEGGNGGVPGRAEAAPKDPAVPLATRSAEEGKS